MLLANSFSQKQTKSINAFVNQSIDKNNTSSIKGGAPSTSLTTWDINEYE